MFRLLPLATVRVRQHMRTLPNHAGEASVIETADLEVCAAYFNA